MALLVIVGSAGISFAALRALGTPVSQQASISAGEREVEKHETTAAPPSPSIVLTPNVEIERIIAANNQYSVGVGIQDISTGEHKAYGLTERFTAASTGKLLTAAAYYHAVETGQQSLDTIIGTRTAQEQLRLLINQSNNDSWELLEQHLGVQSITNYAASINCDYVTVGNTITPVSMASFLSDLYSGQLLNEAHTQQLLSYMQDTNWETLIPAVVPQDITVYHKYGLLTWVIHDVAILVKADKAYALTIYTAGDDYTSNDARSVVIQAITQAVIAQLFDV